MFGRRLLKEHFCKSFVKTSFSFIPLMASEKIFECFFFSIENLAFRLPWPSIKISDLDKIHMVGRGLLQKHFSKTFVKISAVTQK